MAEKQVSVRLVAVGGDKLKAELTGIGREGQLALEGIATNGRGASQALTGVSTSAGSALSQMEALADRIHWMSNTLAHAPAKQRTAVAAMLKTIFAQEGKADAEAQWDTVADAARARRTRSSGPSWTPPGTTSWPTCPSLASTGLRPPARTPSNG